MHIPVLHPDGTADANSDSPSVLGILQPKVGDTVLDVTLGLAGHASAFLQAIGPTGKLIGLDADTKNLATARSNLAPWSNQVIFIHGNFRDVASLGIAPVDIIFADLGVSSPHFDDPSRGFTFRTDAPLDLRYDQSSGESAAMMLVHADERTVATILAKYGEIRGTRKLASLLIERATSGDMRTTDVRAIAEELFSYKAPQLLSQIFQALRIWVNDEMGALENLLAAIPSVLSPGGRAGIISYHSLEDRLVKQAFRRLSTPNRDELTGADLGPAPFNLLTRKSVTPSEQEIERNPRARSARFRAIQRLPASPL